jgi:flagellar biosynthesis/type III secretory pathway chaperone
MVAPIRIDKRGDAIIIMKTNIPWNQLIELLESQIALYRTLMDLIDEESRALIAADLPAFNRLINKKQALVENLKRREAERSAWVAAHAPREDAKHLKNLIASAPQKISSRLAQCRRDLIELTRALDIRNQLHRRMLSHSRDLAENALRLLGNQLYLQPIYAPNGNITGAGKGGAVLSGLA